jgi:hypothetical protein
MQAKSESSTGDLKLNISSSTPQTPKVQNKEEFDACHTKVQQKHEFDTCRTNSATNTNLVVALITS